MGRSIHGYTMANRNWKPHSGAPQANGLHARAAGRHDGRVRSDGVEFGGNKAIRIDNLVRLCEALNTSADFILTGSAAPHSADSLAKQLAALPRAQYEMIEALAAYCLAHPT